MTPEEFVKKHCYNGHTAFQCEKLKDLRAMIDALRLEERERCAKIAEGKLCHCTTEDGHDGCCAACGNRIAAVIRSGVSD